MLVLQFHEEELIDFIPFRSHMKSTQPIHLYTLSKLLKPLQPLRPLKETTVSEAIHYKHNISAANSK